MEKQRDENCDACESMFEEGIEQTVNQVEGNTPRKRDKMRQGAEEAFQKHDER